MKQLTYQWNVSMPAIRQQRFGWKGWPTYKCLSRHAQGEVAQEDARQRLTFEKAQRYDWFLGVPTFKDDE
jgi:hypothetical protein